MNIEPLESRIAPAVVFNFTDVDGDAVTVSISKAIAGDVSFQTSAAGPFAANGGRQLVAIGIAANPTAHGAGITIIAKRQDANGDGFLDGDGLVNVGRIDAAGLDLGAVSIMGDLGRIVAGNPGNPASACKGLTVLSLGRFGTSTGAPDLFSSFDGRLDKLTVKTDVVGASIDVSGAGTTGKIGSVFVGGSLFGGPAIGSGSINAQDGLGAVIIKGDIVGGGGTTSGAVTAEGAIASVTVGGSLIGGPGPNPSSGVIFSSLSSIGPVKIGGDIAGGGTINTGRVFASTGLGSVTVGGSLIGSGFNDTGKIHSDGAIGPVTILGDILGGDGQRSGRIEAGTTLGAVTVGGALKGGGGSSSGRIDSMGAMGAVKIGGDIRGLGTNTASIHSAGALAALTVGGSLIGVGIDSAWIFISGGIGSLKIGGDVIGGAMNSGRITATGKIATVSVGGSIVGGAADFTGNISAGDLPSVSVAGSLVGGTGFVSGTLNAFNSMGVVKVGVDVEGGTISSSGPLTAVTVAGSLIRATILGDAVGAVKIGENVNSGVIASSGALASVTIGGSLIGGATSGTGVIQSGGAMGVVKIGGDVRGSSISGSETSRSLTGYILGDRIGSVFIRGSIISGTDTSNNGSLSKSGAIQALNDIGSITVLGSIVGNRTGDPSPVIIAARGKASLPAANDVAIGKITVGGRVEFTNVLAGYDFTLTGTNADAQIGAVVIGGNMISSNLIAGISTTLPIFGTSADVKITGGKDEPDAAGAISKIASVIVKGHAIGTLVPNDSSTFGIEAQHLVSIKLGGATLSLKAGAGNDVLGPGNTPGPARPLGATFGTTISDGFDFHALEVPLT